MTDQNGFYNESLRLNGASVKGFSDALHTNLTDFEYAKNVNVSIEVPKWAGGKYDGTVLFVAESA